MPAYSQVQVPFPSEISVRNNVVFTMTAAEVGAGVFLLEGTLVSTGPSTRVIPENNRAGREGLVCRHKS